MRKSNITVYSGRRTLSRSKFPMHTYQLRYRESLYTYKRINIRPLEDNFFYWSDFKMIKPFTSSIYNASKTTLAT